MSEMTAFCGLVCTQCPAYLATQAGDYEQMKKVAAGWSSESYPVTPEDVECDGCLSTDKRLFKHCTQCDVRQCGMQKGIENCAHCDEYACEKLTKLWKLLNTDEVKQHLDRIRQSLDL